MVVLRIFQHSLRIVDISSITIGANSNMERHEVPFARRVFIATAIPLAMVLIAVLIARAGAVFLLFFVSALFALILRAGGDLVARYTHMPTHWALGIFILTLLGTLFGSGWFVAPHIADQLDQLRNQMPQAIDELERNIRAMPWAARLLDSVPDVAETAEQQSRLIEQLRGIFSVTVGVITSLIVFFVVGFYLAASPDLYVRTFLQLFPLVKRPRIDEVLQRLAHILRLWLLGRAIGMVFVGVLTAAGLYWLDVPLWLALGFIAGLLDFVPNIGPLLAAIPATLIGLMAGPTQALYVIVLYIAVQQLEAYVVEPIIEQRIVRVAPAFSIIVQILLAVVLGFVGLLLATPLMVALMVLIQELYVKDVLEATTRVEPAIERATR